MTQTINHDFSGAARSGARRDSSLSSSDERVTGDMDAALCALPADLLVKVIARGVSVPCDIVRLGRLCTAFRAAVAGALRKRAAISGVELPATVRQEDEEWRRRVVAALMAVERFPRATRSEYGALLAVDIDLHELLGRQTLMSFLLGDMSAATLAAHIIDRLLPPFELQYRDPQGARVTPLGGGTFQCSQSDVEIDTGPARAMRGTIGDALVTRKSAHATITITHSKVVIDDLEFFSSGGRTLGGRTLSTHRC